MGKITSVSYCMGYESVCVDSQCQLLYGLCICTGRYPVLVIVWVVHLHGKITRVSYFMGCASV